MREGRIRNKYVRGSNGVVNKMRENILRQFGHVMKREDTKAVKVIMKMNVKGG